MSLFEWAIRQSNELWLFSSQAVESGMSQHRNRYLWSLFDSGSHFHRVTRIAPLVWLKGIFFKGDLGLHGMNEFMNMSRGKTSPRFLPNWYSLTWKYTQAQRCDAYPLNINKNKIHLRAKKYPRTINLPCALYYTIRPRFYSII